MGCYYATCEITNLPITYQEYCVMIVFDNEVNLNQTPIDLGRSILSVTKGTYSDYGSLEDMEDLILEGVGYRGFIKQSVWDKVVSTITLDYNPEELILEYKRLDEISQVDTVATLKFMEISHTIRHRHKISLNHNYINETHKILTYMSYCRLSFSGANYDGTQHTSYRDHYLRAQLIQEEITNAYNRESDFLDEDTTLEDYIDSDSGY